MNNNLFEISHLECAYNHKRKPVLVIEDLIIPKGKITLILGKSGSGKSTLIETLGLMNNTIKNGDITFHNGHETIHINQSLWQNPRKLSEIRKKYFSFIFQEDYLIPYYSSFENVVIGPLIQETELNFNILRSVISKMNSVKLPPKPLHSRMPNEMAGGQKQRLSFVRAIMKDFTVIFGDEPTGNLDVANSESLMDVLRKSLSGIDDDDQNPRSAIIVSHNIELSIKKADMILVLTSADKSNGLHTIEGKYTFIKDNQNSWISGEGKIYKSNDLVERHIKSIL